MRKADLVVILSETGSQRTSLVRWDGGAKNLSVEMPIKERFFVVRLGGLLRMTRRKDFAVR